MGSVYRTSEGNLVLYAQEEKIYLRTLVREGAGRAVVLASDYAADLTDILYRGTVYYAYKNTEGEILVRNIADHGIWYRLGEEGGPEGYRPRLAVIGERLVLFYAVKNPLDGQYSLRCQVPDGQDKEQLSLRWRRLLQDFGTVGTEPPQVQVVSGGNGTLLALDAERMIWWDADGKGTPISQSSSLAGEMMEDRMEEIRRKTEEEMTENLRQARQQWEAESQQIQRRQQEQYQTKIRERDLLIESIKKQYDDLRQVAETYREEAIKWRS